MTAAAAEDAVTVLVNEVFVANGALLEAGDALTAELGLTAAQWQVLGFLADGASTVAQLARRRGLRRQSVQETVNGLWTRELVERTTNPDDARAPLWRLGPGTGARLARLTERRRCWAARVAASLDPEALAVTTATLAELSRVVRADTRATGADSHHSGTDDASPLRT